MQESPDTSASAPRIIPIKAVGGGGSSVAGMREETIFLYSKEEKVYPREVKGRYTSLRWVFVWLTQLFFYGVPWINWNGRQAMLFDLDQRRFYLFNLVLHPQDFIYLAVLLIVCAYGLFLFTAVAGRVWCGFTCPQTVYTEIFLWIERKFEGDRQRRMKLDKAAFSFEKLARKSGKQAAWIAVSLWTGLTFVGFFTPIRELVQSILALGIGPWEAFWVLFYGFATYGNAGYLREQVCKYMCPYARFQSAMFDRDTLVISYDEKRGEPRGARSRKADGAAQGQGDCINCTLCVQVCPVGIDIRDGLQYECIGCAACVDVCNTVMDKVGSPRGLIRYATQNAMEKNWGNREVWNRMRRPRVLIYTAVLALIVGAFIYSVYTRDPFKVDIVRDRGAMARLVEEGYIENVYRIQLMNATESPQRYRVGMEKLPHAIVTGGDKLLLGPAESRWVPISVKVPPETGLRLGSGAHAVTLVVEQLRQGSQPQTAVREKTTFMVPR